jgi:hypothetical protein
MLVASSKDALKKKLEGVGVEVQGSDMGDLQESEVHAKIKAKGY